MSYILIIILWAKVIQKTNDSSWKNVLDELYLSFN
jgi:hypothetical protein